MFFRLFSSTLRKNLFSERRFRTNQWHLKDAREMKQSANEVSDDEPVKYSTSDAGKWKAVYSTSGEDYYKYPKSQSTAVALSLTAFITYFLILREENDLDDWLRQLDTEIPLKLEQAQLRTEITHGTARGLDVSYQMARLEQINNRLEKKNE